MKLIRKKKRLWKNLKTNGSADLFLKFKDLRRKTKKLIISRYQQYLQSFAKRIPKAKQIPETVIYGDPRSRDLNSKVKLFNVFFHSVHSKSTTDVNLLATDVGNPNLLSEITTILYSSRA